ncbi:MAG: hypothetical protein ABI091_21075 [Ferruginibacter sp.]
MNNNLKNILSSLNKDTEQNKLLEYLSEKLTPEERHAVESNMNDDEFMSDAMDGLNELKNKENISSTIDQLNTRLKKQLQKKKEKKIKRKIPSQTWAYYTIIILLILIILAWVIIKRL